jgi:hypothetical protein
MRFNTAVTTKTANVFPLHLNHLHELPCLVICEKASLWMLKMPLNGVWLINNYNKFVTI